MATQTTLGEWLNECTYQLGLINDGAAGDDSFDGSNVTNAQRRNIRVSKMAIVVEFDHGPPVILGGTADWTSDQNWNTCFAGDTFDELANDLVGDNSADRYVKLVKGVVGVLGTPNNNVLPSTYEAKGTSALATLWPAGVEGEGWGITIGTLPNTTGTEAAGYEVGTMLINHPTAYTASGGSHDPDTYLYKRAHTSGSWSQITDAANWGTQSEGAGDNYGYNSGDMTKIRLFIRTVGSVTTVNTSAEVNSTVWSSSNSGSANWIELISHNLVAGDSVYDTGTADNESITKLGWYGPHDKVLDASEEPTQLDVNDGIQDVRIRFSLKGRSDLGTSSGCWAPKNLLSFAMGASAADSYTGDCLLPSRISILSNNTPFTDACTLTEELQTSQGAGLGYQGLEVLTSLVDLNRAVTGTQNPPYTDFIRNVGNITVGLSVPSASDNSTLESVIIERSINGPRIAILTDIIQIPREGSGGLVSDITDDGTNITVNPNNVTTGDGDRGATAKVEGLGSAVGEETVNIHRWLYESGQVASGFAGAVSSDDRMVGSFVEQLTLLLFDPQLFWSDSFGTNTYGDPDSNLGTFGKYNNMDYFFFKIVPFQPHAQFTSSDKLKITVPLGSTKGS